jgi:hypothetical protein
MAPGRNAGEIITDLKLTTVVTKGWSELKKEYEPKYHPVMTDQKYLDETDEGGITKVTRITIGLQKLAVKRMTQLMFGIPVKRIYTPENDTQKEIAKLIEAIYERNRIDTINLDRGKYMFASCESCTIWYAQEEKNNIYGMPSNIKIRCKSYSPMHGDLLYPLFDEFDDLIALSFEYVRKEGTEQNTYFDTYTKDLHIGWKISGSDYSEVVNETHKLGKIPGVYIHRHEPIWEDTSNQVYEIEWTLSRNGNYIRKNAKPLFVVFADQAVNTGAEAKADPNATKAVFQFPANGKAQYVTWESANESIKLQIENLYRSFFTQIQIPDMSFDQMKTTPMSGEARKMMFIDAQLKVLEESGRWLELLDREVNIIKAFVKTIIPGKDDDVDGLKVETIITPFKISDETETIKNIAAATGGLAIVSQIEGIRTLGWSEDPEKTLREINDQQKASQMTNLFNPTV